MTLVIGAMKNKRTNKIKGLTMTDNMKCPICGKDLVEIELGECWFLACDNSKCRCKGVASYIVWEHFDRTRKALDVANEKLRHCVNITVEELDELKGNLLIAWNALLHFSKDPIANNALKKITALEQKD